MAVRVIDKDMGWRRIKSDLEDLKDGSLRVGVLRGEYPDGTPVSLVAAVNEFGTSDGHVPERSFLRSTLGEERDNVERMFSNGVGRIIDGLMDREKLFRLVGEYLQGKIQQKIVNVKSPPNAPSTIERKGSSNPLIDTGQLRQSIRYEVGR